MSNIDRKFISKVPEVSVLEVRDAYVDINASFDRYFGRQLRSGSINQITITDEVSPRRAGSYDTRTGDIKIYPYWSKEDLIEYDEIYGMQHLKRIRPDWRRLLAHEMGHGLHYEYLSDHSLTYAAFIIQGRGKNSLARESFANLGAMVDSGKGDSSKVTELLRPHLEKPAVLYPPSRILSYPREEDYYKDPALLHCAFQKTQSFDALMALVMAAPSLNFGICSAINSLRKLALGKSLEQDHHSQYQEFFATLGVDINKRFDGADKWYGQ